MSNVIRLLAENPLLLLFLVAAIGYPLGQLRVAGTNLGVGAVLFAGLAIGSLDPSLRLPEICHLLGLVLFVYTVGLANGASFVAALVRGRGLRVNALVVLVLVVMAGLTFVMQRVLHLSAPMAAGMFAGTLTNTPTLAAQLEFLRQAGAESAEPVVAYSLMYPVGVLGMIVALMIARRRLRPLAPPEPERAGITMVVARVKNPDATAEPLGELVRAQRWRASFGRFKRGDDVRVATPMSGCAWATSSRWSAHRRSSRASSPGLARPRPSASIAVTASWTCGASSSRTARLRDASCATSTSPDASARS